MKNLCNNCPHGKDRETCSELCAEALAYADQDYVGREKAFNIPGLQTSKGSIQFRVPEKPEEIAMEAFLLRKQGKSYGDIAIHLECSEHFLREVLDED